MRKSIVVYGNCQAGMLSALLRRCKSINENYDIHHHFVYMDESEAISWKKQALEANIYMVQDVDNWVSYPYREIADGKRLIKFPFIYFAALWPFDAHQNHHDAVAGAINPALPERLRFLFHDALLARLRDEVSDHEERFRRYRTLDYRRPLNLRRFFETEKLRLARMDKMFSISIGEAIIDEFQTRNIFHTITHPAIGMTMELAKEVSRLADIGFSVEDENLSDPHDHYQVPVHPLVIDALNIKWAGVDTLYRFHGVYMTFEAYIRAYIFVYG